MNILVALVAILTVVFLPYIIGRYFPIMNDNKDPQWFIWIEGIFVIIVIGGVGLLAYGIYSGIMNCLI